MNSGATKDYYFPATYFLDKNTTTCFFLEELKNPYHNLVLQGDFLGLLLSRGSNQSQVGNDLLGVFSLSSTRFSSNQHGLILKVSQHVAVGSLRDSPQVGRNFIPSLANVQLDNTCSVNGEALVWVDNNAEKTRVGVDELGLKADFQVVEDRGIIEEGQVGHVLTFLKLGWIDLTHLSRWEDFFLDIEEDINFYFC